MSRLVPLQKALYLALVLSAVAPVQAAWQGLVPEARRVGSGEMRWFGFALYEAQLWAPAASARAVVTLTTPFALQLNYRRSISRDVLVEASLTEIRRMAAAQPDPAQLQRWEQEMRQAFVDVREGDQITGVFLPGEGARFYVGTRLQHLVRDQSFARAFFLIWLDPRTRNPELRAQLLGRAP